MQIPPRWVRQGPAPEGHFYATEVSLAMPTWRRDQDGRTGKAGTASERQRKALPQPCVRLFQRRVLDVVLGGVLVRELVDHVRAVAVGVVDLHERFPLLWQS